MKQYWVKAHFKDGYTVVDDDGKVFNTTNRRLAYAVAGLMLDVQLIEAGKMRLVERDMFMKRLEFIETHVNELPEFVILYMVATELPDEIL